MRALFGVLGAALLAGSAGAAPTDGNACRLLTAKDIAAVQKASPAETKPTSRLAGGYAIEDCFYRVDPFASSVSLEVTRRAPGAGGHDPAERWERMFRAEAGEAERDEEKEHEGDGKGDGSGSGRREGPEVRGIEKEKAPPLEIEGVGDEAFWIGNRASGVLYALRGHAYVRVSVGGAGTEEEKRAKAVELARRALRRL